MVRTSGRRAARVLVFGLAAAVGGLVATGCKSKSSDGPSAGAAAKGGTAADSDLGKQEKDLLARRDALLNTRLQLKTKRQQLAEKRQAIRDKGGDTSAIDEETDQLARQEDQLVDKEKAVNTQLDSMLSERRALLAALSSKASGQTGVAAREAAVAAREKQVAERENKLAQREADLEKRAEQLATKWKESCAAGTTIVETVDAKGSKYNKRDVEPLLARARSAMNRKGILRFDLPDPARGLESEATRAMAKGDYGRAHFAATQLYSTVRSMRVDKSFISDKIRRLNADIKGKKLSNKQQASIDHLFRAATASYGDGKFVSANRQLNRIYATLN